jgi:hypothetical protein
MAAALASPQVLDEVMDKTGTGVRALAVAVLVDLGGQEHRESGHGPGCDSRQSGYRGQRREERSLDRADPAGRGGWRRRRGGGGRGGDGSMCSIS